MPRFHLVLPTGKFPVPLSVVYPRDNAKGRSEVQPFYSIGLPPVNRKRDVDHEKRLKECVNLT